MTEHGDTGLGIYRDLLGDIKSRVRAAQGRAALSANAEMILLYWDVGRMILERQEREGWGTNVIPRLAVDLKNELPEEKGFSERNLGYMIQFAREYGPPSILQQAAAKLTFQEDESDKSEQKSSLPILQQPAAKIRHLPESPLISTKLAVGLPWFHHVVLIQKIKDLPTRLWYAQQALEQGWSRATLTTQIKNCAHERQGGAVTNFDRTLPAAHAEIATQLLKDPYVFDFLTLAEPFQERELEVGLLTHIQKFLLELGRGFAFVGRQYRLDVGEKEFYLDLLFYHLHVRCFVAIDLKKGDFKPEYAGKMNFYCSAVDDQLRHEHDAPTVGLILCQNKDRVVAEYALRDIHKPIGVADYELTRALPANLASSLPSIEEIEAELTETLRNEAD
ncbi:MAG: DUF1016 family protein [Candidatus Hydrogenedentes bacterium]|nr:DUF1016 family protein [Candidatus Hydrogenedentota bacterium]